MNINIAVNLPTNIEDRLRAENEDLSNTAREALAIELFRRGILGHHDLGQSLSLDRFETDALLKRYKVAEHALTHEDVDADVRNLNELLARSRS
jgi:predicted HTH domain antitoxin